MAPRIAISLRGRDAFIAPESYLASDFSRYLSTVRAIGGFYVTSPSKGHTVPLVGLNRAIKALADAGFEPAISDELRTSALADAEAEKSRLGASVEHVEKTREELARRGLKLWTFQEIGQQWLRSRKTALFGDDMGLGKTIQALCAAPFGAPVLVICPAVAKGVWLRESAKWRPDLRPIVLKGRGSFRWPAKGELVIINWDILPEEASAKHKPEDLGELFGAGPDGVQEGTILIGDEFHVVKNSKTNRHERWKGIKKLVLEKGGSAWGLTGTPLLNKPPDLWNVLKSLDLAEEAFTSWPQFVRLFGGYKDGYGYQWSGEVGEEVPSLLRRVMLGRRREAVLQDIPPKVWEVESVEIPDGTKVILNKAMAEASGKGINLEDHGVDLAKIQHLMFSQFSAIRAAVADATTASVEEWVEQFEESGEPVVVFSAHRAPVEKIGSRPGWAIINGDTPPEDRTKIEDAFQSGHLKGIAATIAAGGVAITLTRSHRCAFVDLDWTPALNKQAEDRLCRFGQTRGVIITRFVADHVMTRHIHENLSKKQEVLEASVEAARSLHPAEPEQDALEAIKNAPRASERPQRGSGTSGGQKSSPGPVPAAPGGPSEPPRFRKAQGGLEEWAAKGLVMVAGLDGDRARARNDMGFSKFDSDFGQKLAELILNGGLLSEKQWSCVVKMARKYRRQIGEPPASCSPEGT